MTDTQTTLDDFIIAPEQITVLRAAARIDDAKADKLYALATSKSGVSPAVNGAPRVFPAKDDKELKATLRDIRKHVDSRLKDGYVSRVTYFKPQDGSDGVSFKVTVAEKSNRGRKPKDAPASK